MPAVSRLVQALAYLWVLTFFTAGCYSASLLTTPEPVPVRQVRGTQAIGAQPAPRGTDFADGNPLVPVPEGAVRTGVAEGIDVGLKLGPLSIEANSLIRLAQGESWILSAMPGLGAAWLWERPGEGWGHAGQWRALGSVDTATRVTTARLPVLLGWHGPRDRFGVVFGPTIHAGYRSCRNVTKYDPDVSARVAIHTCTPADEGAVVAWGGHFGFHVAIGTFVKVMPELGLLTVPIAPAARLVNGGETRTKLSRSDRVVHFAFGFQIGRFTRRTRPSWLDDL